tara:strand:+ start:402 stop:887 length:486 start_codon:yes stop_codon:yes gene_type:complete
MKNYYEFLGLKNEKVSKHEIVRALQLKEKEFSKGTVYDKQNLKQLQKIKNTLLDDYEKGKYDAKFMETSDSFEITTPFSNLFISPSSFENDFSKYGMTVKSYSQHTSRTPDGYEVYTREMESENGKVNKDVRKKVIFDKKNTKVQQEIIDGKKKKLLLKKS